MTDYSSAEQSSEEEEEEYVHLLEYYRAHAEEINSVDVVPAYSDGTIGYIDRLDELWTR